jgi:hypothetical protein
VMATSDSMGPKEVIPDSILIQQWFYPPPKIWRQNTQKTIERSARRNRNNIIINLTSPFQHTD